MRPTDAKAIYRFVYLLVHPSLEVPAEILTSRRSGHLDSVPRQGRRKPTREELTARIDSLERTLEEGDKQNVANVVHIERLERELAAGKEKTSELEKQKRRIIAMLSDALRTGMFPDQSGHNSLIGRVEEDAPSALDYRTQSLLTPSDSDGTPSGKAPDGVGQRPASQAAACQGPTQAGLLQGSCDTGLDDDPSQTLSSDLYLGGHGVEFSWLELFNESGENCIAPGA